MISNEEMIIKITRHVNRLEKQREILIKGIKELDLTNVNNNNPKISKMLEIVRKYENL